MPNLLSHFKRLYFYFIKYIDFYIYTKYRFYKISCLLKIEQAAHYLAKITESSNSLQIPKSQMHSFSFF